MIVNIKKEENPTLRLSEDELKIYERNKWNIYMTRGVLGYSFFNVLYSARHS